MTQNKEQLINYLLSNGKNKSWSDLAYDFNLASGEIARNTWLRYRKKTQTNFKESKTIQFEESDLFKEFLSWKEEKFNSSNTLNLKPYITDNKSNVLVIPDIHLPFEIDGFLLFLRETQEKYDCGTIIFIGDIIDNHASSFHTPDPDGYSAKSELDIAITKLKEWYRLFPEATVILGNHDRMAMRKAFASGLASKWVKGYGEVLGTPNWEFTNSITIDNVLYIHGEGAEASTEVSKRFTSIVQGHRHSLGYVNFIQNQSGNYFAVQVGTGIDESKYAFAYGKNTIIPILSCAVILDNGTQPILIPFSNKKK